MIFSSIPLLDTLGSKILPGKMKGSIEDKIANPIIVIKIRLLFFKIQTPLKIHRQSLFFLKILQNFESD